jgi:hypothetical protein
MMKTHPLLSSSARPDDPLEQSIAELGRLRSKFFYELARQPAPQEHFAEGLRDGS